jgi:hypothetical protein
VDTIAHQERAANNPDQRRRPGRAFGQHRMSDFWGLIAATAPLMGSLLVVMLLELLSNSSHLF